LFMLASDLMGSKMDQAECPPQVHAHIPPEADSGILRGREDYLNRLGIQKSGTCPRSVMAAFSCSSSRYQEPQAMLDIESKVCSFSKVRSTSESKVEAEHAVCSPPFPSTPRMRTPSSSPPSSPSSAKQDAEDESVSDSCHEVKKWVDLKGNDNFRISLLRKLSYEKVWVPPPERLPKHQSVIIFDWDDTLLCTSYLNQAEAAGRPMSAAAQAHLQGIERTSKQLLELAISLGQTYIITNARQGWVEYSAAKWVPDLLPVLQSVEIISARTRHGAQYPGNVSMWKIHAFSDLQKQLDLPVITNLVSMGDADYEMEATQIIAADFSEALVKTIKLQERPDPEVLLKQLTLVADKFKKIVHSARNAKICLEPKKKK